MSLKLNKILLIGNDSVGKTSLIKNLQQSKVPQMASSSNSTNAVAGCAVKIITKNHEKIQLVFWDSGTCPSDTLLKIFLQKVDVVVIVIDVNSDPQLNLKTIVELTRRTERLTNFDPLVKIAIFGNKIDLYKQDISILRRTLLDLATESGIENYEIGHQNDIQSLMNLVQRTLFSITFFPQYDPNEDNGWIQSIQNNLRSSLSHLISESSRSIHDFRKEHHIPLRCQTISTISLGCSSWIELENACKKTVIDSLNNLLPDGIKNQVDISLTKINQPTGVDISRTTLLVSVWFDVTSKETKPIAFDKSENEDPNESTTTNCTLS